MKEMGVRKLRKGWHNRVASEPECVNVTLLLVAPDGPMSEQRREPWR
jgi:hypothetical protein